MSKLNVCFGKQELVCFLKFTPHLTTKTYPSINQKKLDKQMLNVRGRFEVTQDAKEETDKGF